MLIYVKILIADISCRCVVLNNPGHVQQGKNYSSVTVFYVSKTKRLD